METVIRDRQPKSLRVSSYVLLAVLFVITAKAQNTVDWQAWGETDFYWQFHPDVRLVVASAHDRDVNYTDVKFETFLDFYVPRFRPILFRRLVERDDARMQRIVLRMGYVASHSVGEEPSTLEHRPLAEGTLRWAFPFALLLSDRNRFEFRIVNGMYSWRYRNRVRIERDFKVRTLPLTTYVSTEGFYDSKAGSVNRLRYSGGLVLPINRWFFVEPYFTRQSTSNVEPRNENAVGLTLQFYLSQ
jgi:hypothetical protein